MLHNEYLGINIIIDYICHTWYRNRMVNSEQEIEAEVTLRQVVMTT